MPPFIKKSQDQKGRASYVINRFNLNELTDIWYYEIKNDIVKLIQTLEINKTACKHFCCCEKKQDEITFHDNELCHKNLISQFYGYIIYSVYVIVS